VRKAPSRRVTWILSWSRVLSIFVSPKKSQICARTGKEKTLARLRRQIRNLAARFVAIRSPENLRLQGHIKPIGFRRESTTEPTASHAQWLTARADSSLRKGNDSRSETLCVLPVRAGTSRACPRATTGIPRLSEYGTHDDPMRKGYE